MIITFDDISWNTFAELREALDKAGEELTSVQKTFVSRTWLVNDHAGLIRQLQTEYSQPEKYKWVYYMRRYETIAIVQSVPYPIFIRRGWNSIHEYKSSNIDVVRNPFQVVKERTVYKTSPINYDRLMEMIVENHTTKPCDGYYPIMIDKIILGYESASDEDNIIEYRISIGDHGKRTWIEVVFNSVEDAIAFDIKPEYKPFIDKEITSNPGESLISYWNHTRTFPYQSIN